MLPLDSATQPTKSRAPRIWLIALAVYLACSVAMFVYIGHLVMEKAKAREAWNRSHPTASRLLQQKGFPRHDGPIARVDELNGTGRIYLVQMGDHTAPYSIDDLAQWLHSKYALDVQVLPPMALEQPAWDSKRKQYVAELLYEQIKNQHPDLTANPDAHLIGITDADMYSIRYDWAYSRTQRFERDAVISTYQEIDWYNRTRKVEGTGASGNEFLARVRRIMLKDVAIVYWHLPGNYDPTSLLQGHLDPAIPADDIYESDLNPARTSTGEFVRSPGIFLAYSAQAGIKLLPGDPITETDREDSELTPRDESQEIFEVNLAAGLLIDRHYDFDLPGSVPIQFQRVTRDGWKGPHPFGVSGTDSYDQYMWSANSTKFAVIDADGSQNQLVSTAAWLAWLSPVKHNSLVKYVDTNCSGQCYEMRWRSGPFGHYELKRYDGVIRSYLPGDEKTPGYLTGISNAHGQELKFTRDEAQRLTQLVSPNGSWLRLSYGPNNHIVEIDDSRGRVVRYGYNDRNQLATVAYPSGETYYYEYDSTQHLLAFSVAPDAKTGPHVLLRNEYENGRVVKQTLADGSAFTYKYTVADDGAVDGVVVRTPEGRVFNLEICHGYSDSTVREETQQPATKKGRIP